MEPGNPSSSTREELAAELRELKRRSPYSYQALARSIDRPASTLHGWISARHLPYSRDNDDFLSMVRLLDAPDPGSLLESVLELRSRSDDSVQQPYLGLASFTEKESAVFFGREELTESLVDRTLERIANQAPHPLVVVGASGTGKTSLLRAGLLASLTQREPTATITYATPSGSDSYNYRGAFDQGRDSPGDRIVILDQFEECFSYAQAEEFDLILKSIDEFCSEDNTLVVIGIRSDFFHRAAEIPSLMKGLQDNPVVVGTMSLEGVSRAIVKPAEQASIRIAPGLLAALISEISDGPNGDSSANSLPALSHVLREMVKTCSDGELTLDDYRAVGGLRKAIERSAEEAYLAIGPNPSDCRLLFSHLVEIGADSKATRRAARLDTLRELDPESGCDELIAEFASHRLLTIYLETVSISHEALLESWPRLGIWIDEVRATLLSSSRIQSAAQVWIQTGRDSDLLLRGSQLAIAEALLVTPSARVRLSEEDIQFVTASQAAEAAREQRALETTSRQIAVQSELLHAIDANLSAQLSVVAHRTAPTVESRSALLGSTSPLPGTRLLGEPGPTALATSANGLRIAFSGAADQSIRIVDLAALKPQPALLESQSTSYSLAFSADANLLAAGGYDGSLNIWNLVNSGEPNLLTDDRSKFVGPVHALHFSGSQSGSNHLFVAGEAREIACWNVDDPTQPTLDFVIPTSSTTLGISADGDTRLLAAANKDGTVTVWDVEDTATPMWIQQADGEDQASAVALSPNGLILAAGYHDGRVRVWSLDASGQIVTEFQVPGSQFGSWVNDVRFSGCGEFLGAASSDGNVRLWNTANWSQGLRDLHHPTVVTSLRFLTNETLATTAEDGAMRTWNIAEARELSKNESIWSIGFDRTGETRVIASRPTVSVTTVDKSNNSTFETNIRPNSHGDFSGATAISPAGKLLAIGTRSGVVEIAAAGPHPGDDWQRMATLHELSGLVENLTFSSSGSLLCGVDTEGTVQIWTFDDSGEARPAGQSSVEPPATCPAFSSDGTFVAVTSESGNTTLFTISATADLRPLATVRTGDSFALGACFHPRLPVLAVGNADRSTSIWDCTNPAKPDLIQRLTGPAGHTITVSFNHTGSLLAVGTTNGVVWVWDTEVPAEPMLHAKIKSQQQGVYALAFSPSDNTLTAGGPGRQLSTWMLDEAEAMEAITNSIGDRVTPGEWQRHLPTLPFVP